MSGDVQINCVGLWLPVKVLLCPEIKGHETLLFGQIAALQGNPRYCYASNEYFSKFLGLAKSTVSEYIKGLQDKGFIDIVRGRDDQGQEERQIILSPKGADLFRPDTPLAEPAPPSAERSPLLRNTEAPPSAERTQIKDINKSLSARVREAGGEALADPASCPEIAVMRDLNYLLIDRPDAPACTEDEIVDAVTVIAAWFLKHRGKGSMRSWRQVQVKALEFRDARLNGVPVKEPPKGEAPPSAGSPAGWGIERWRSVINLANMKRVWVVADWGAEPGAEGSFVPQELVALWKGSAKAD